MAIDKAEAIGILNDMAEDDLQAMNAGMFQKHIDEFYRGLDEGLRQALEEVAHAHIGNDMKVKVYFEVKRRYTTAS